MWLDDKICSDVVLLIHTGTMLAFSCPVDAACHVFISNRTTTTVWSPALHLESYICSVLCTV